MKHRQTARRPPRGVDTCRTAYPVTAAPGCRGCVRPMLHRCSPPRAKMIDHVDAQHAGPIGRNQSTAADLVDIDETAGGDRHEIAQETRLHTRRSTPAIMQGCCRPREPREAPSPPRTPSTSRSSYAGQARILNRHVDLCPRGLPAYGILGQAMSHKSRPAAITSSPQPGGMFSTRRCRWAGIRQHGSPPYRHLPGPRSWLADRRWSLICVAARFCPQARLPGTSSNRTLSTQAVRRTQPSPHSDIASG